MAISELITPPKGNAHKTGKGYNDVEELLNNMSKKAVPRVKSTSKKSSEKMIKVEDSFKQYISEYEFFDADDLNLHAPPVAIEEIEMLIVN